MRRSFSPTFHLTTQLITFFVSQLRHRVRAEIETAAADDDDDETQRVGVPAPRYIYRDILC